jgi:hypothetical protein
MFPPCRSSRPARKFPLQNASVIRMTKWEYVTVPLLTHATKQILDNWGDEGYELVAVVPGPNAEQLVAYMKRPKE